MVIVLERVPVSALQFSFVSGLCCAQLWLQFPGVVRRSLFFGLGVCILHLQYVIAMRCRVILGFQVAAAMLHFVKLRFFVVGGGAQIGRMVVVLVALGVSRAVFGLLICLFVKPSLQAIRAETVVERFTARMHVPNPLIS